MSKIDKKIFQIVKEGFEEQKGIQVLSIYEWNDDIYGVYINNPIDSLSFIKAPLYNMHTDIDGHNIFMMELGELLYLAYDKASIQMYNWLINPSEIVSDNDEIFKKLIDICKSNPPLQLSSFQLIKWIDRLNDDDINYSASDLIDMVQHFMTIEQLDIDVSDKSSESIMKNNLNEVKQLLMEKKYDKIDELTIYEIDKLYVKLQMKTIIYDR
jgi:hypothetical protein